MVRKQSWRSTLTALIAVAALGCGPLAAAQTPEAQTPKESQARLEELRANIKALKSELDKVKGSRSELLSDLEKTETKMGELNQKVETLKKELQNKQSQLQELRSEKEALVRAKKQQQGSVAQHLDAAYRLGRQSRFKLLLNQQDPAQFARNLKYFDYVIAARARQIKSLDQTTARLSEVEPALAATAAELETNRQNLLRERDVLGQNKQERQRTLQLLEQSIANKDNELKALETDRQQLETLLQRVAAAAKAAGSASLNQPFAKLKGKLPWPTKGKLLQNFGSSRMQGKLHWQGMLIGAGEGEPVQAIHKGQIVFADYLRGHGLLVIVDHGGGFMSLYAHNQTLYKSVGDQVTSGEQIASVGQSGGRESAALYFELRADGAPIDPRQWLKKAG